VPAAVTVAAVVAEALHVAGVAFSSSCDLVVQVIVKQSSSRTALHIRDDSEQLNLLIRQYRSLLCDCDVLQWHTSTVTTATCMLVHVSVASDSSKCVV
jgi:hypothetical protein